jgi:stalled ribosome alternative rescue factor ArfA
MALTDEQRERIRKNRERALQLQKLRRETGHQNDDGDGSYDKKRKKISNELVVENISSKSPSVDSITKKTKSSENPVEPYEEEIGKSEWVTKKEAMAVYCLPEGTLAVCECKEQDNPHNKAWAPMKLYRRAEIRQRAHARYGGSAGLAMERTRRSERKFVKDFGGAKDLFR